MIFDKCPHCRAAHVQLRPLYSHHWGGAGNRVYCNVAMCQNGRCGRLIFFLSDAAAAGHQPTSYGFVYPLLQGTLPPDLDLPDRVRDEFSEAAECLEIGAYLASMTMSRRVLQRCLKAHGFSQRTLHDQIEAASADGTIPKRYSELATEIRQYGNLGAHPDDDRIELVTPENADQLLQFVGILIEEFYVLPARAKALQTQRTQT